MSKPDEIDVLLFKYAQGEFRALEEILRLARLGLKYEAFDEWCKSKDGKLCGELINASKWGVQGE